jgi:hypothetical protein
MQKCEFDIDGKCTLMQLGRRCGKTREEIIACLGKYLLQSAAAVQEHGTAANPGIGQRVAKAEDCISQLQLS